MSDRRQGGGRGAAPGPGGRAHGMLPGEKANDFRGTMRRLIAALRPYRWHAVAVLVLAAGSTLFMIAGPRILGQATTLLFEGAMSAIAGGVGIDFVAIGRVLTTVLALYVVSAGLSFAMGWLSSGVAVGLTYDLRSDIARKINRLPLRYYDTTTHGEILSRITNDVDTINQTLSQSLTQIVTSAVTVVGVIIMMLSIDWRMTLTAMVMIPLSLAVVAFIVKRSQRYFRSQQEYLGHVNGHVEEMFSGHAIVKTYGAEAASIATFDRHNDELYDSAWKSQFLSGLMMPLMNVVGNVGYVAVTVLGAALAGRGVITVGDIQAFIQYIRNFTQPLMSLANVSNVLQQTAAAAERVFAFLDEEQEVEETAEPVDPGVVAGRVTFEGVSFGYRADTPVIRDLSFAAAPGETVAIVGPTGAGKTTIVKLLMRFYDVDSGRVTLDGIDVREMRRADLRGQIAMVLQDTWLSSTTVLENIRYGRPDATDDEVIAAAEAAHVDHFIRTWPGGYGMVINEETSNISQGQKQLLTIARALLADPRILILDEATSSVDTRTEGLIQRAMDRLMADRTSFVIAHRLSTIRNADRILVMRDGGVVEQGTHDELLAADGFYAELYNSQFDHVAAV